MHFYFTKRLSKAGSYYNGIDPGDEVPNPLDAAKHIDQALYHRNCQASIIDAKPPFSSIPQYKASPPQDIFCYNIAMSLHPFRAED